MSTTFVRLQLSEQVLSLPKHGNVILNSITQTSEKWDSHVWVGMTFEWYEDAMIFHVVIFLFSFRSNFKNGFLDESDFRHCCDNFSESASLITTMFKVTSWQLRGTLTTSFWKTPYIWRFYGLGLKHVQILLSRLD